MTDATHGDGVPTDAAALTGPKRSGLALASLIAVAAVANVALPSIGRHFVESGLPAVYQTAGAESATAAPDAPAAVGTT